MTTLGFIRHGTTEWNLAGRLQGQMDTPLAEVGREQASLLAKRLARETWDGIIASDLMRAKETAQTISDVTGTPIYGYDARLRERAFGELEGTTLDDRVKRWGEDWRTLDLGMEPDDNLLSRWGAFLSDLEDRYGGKRILVVSHGGFIAPVLASHMGRKIEEHLQNTSLTVLERSGDGWECRLLNCTEHLSQQDNKA
ncbi:histidine phosphatase family protein [Paenibacillus allorhizosphaerae]|uniref:Phosphoserine phosphatase 2 n=1 Tax=Paenibacillus allorhizosphaerae TaxID=2849866 RepID=A0ABN7TTS7_9BACL|nr:histidine phosphatase family protein [Paenibacillus allorhizosphaerae]CAG7648847.1 Putative phosphoserine phosphatase 2 [Paenibacillus allorhizosphaerae]